METNINQVVVPKSVATLKRRVRRLYQAWWFTHYAIGLFGVVAGTTLTAITSANNPEVGLLAALKSSSPLIGIIAAVCTSLVTFLGPIGKAERYWSAFHALDQASLEYEQGLITVRRFVARVKTARMILQTGGATDEQLSDAFKDAEREVNLGSRSQSVEPRAAVQPHAAANPA